MSDDINRAITIIDRLLDFVPEKCVLDKSGKLVTSWHPRHRSQNEAIAHARAFIAQHRQ